MDYIYSAGFMVLVLFLASELMNPAAAASKCPKAFDCGRLWSLEFPISESPECGLFLVNCTASPPNLQLGAGGQYSSDLLGVDSTTNTFHVVDTMYQEMLEQRNCRSFFRRTPPDSPFFSFNLSPSITVLLCDKSLNLDAALRDYFKDFSNYTTCPDKNQYYGYPKKLESRIPADCYRSQLPAKSNYRISDPLFQLLSSEFDLHLNVSRDCLSCHHRGGQCTADITNKFQCNGGGTKIKRKTAALVAAVSAGTILLVCTWICMFLATKRKYALQRLQNDTANNQNAIKLFLQNNGSLATTRFKYSDLKRMTKAFTQNLGKGGYGSVYKGKLPDGRPVAVKILTEATSTGEEFINEVASISRTSHVNIVTLLGFCFEGSKRALIYEFMPNGSLEKFILKNTPSSAAACRLPYDKLFNIAVGTARGLEYLHQGCNMRIVHFDIKPHNILLDEDFNPKISDFGLAKLCPNRSSVLSMLVGRGTIGYIAPEVFCRNFGGVSYKSDVYSYGMMILEMVIGKQSLDNRTHRSSEMYFPDWIYKRLQADCRVGFIDVIKEDEWELAKKLVIVGLWCIQTIPKNRPSMSTVIAMLLGSIDSLEIPPEPYFDSPLALEFGVPSTSGISTDQNSS